MAKHRKKKQPVYHNNNSDNCTNDDKEQLSLLPGSAGYEARQAQLAANNPITVRYNSRCGAIRVEEGRGTITKEFAAAAKALAKEHKQLAASDPVYAAKRYIADMERGKLYADTDKRMK